jgi:hypothetical protein
MQVTWSGLMTMIVISTTGRSLTYITIVIVVIIKSKQRYGLLRILATS